GEAGPRRGRAPRRDAGSRGGLVGQALALGPRSPAPSAAVAARELPGHEPYHEDDEDPAGRIQIDDEPADHAERGEEPEECDIPRRDLQHHNTSPIAPPATDPLQVIPNS